jgi:hypothetical protein
MSSAPRTDATAGILLVSLCDCDLAPVLAEIGDHAEVETIRLEEEPTRAVVDGLVARLRGRRLALHAEDTVDLDRFVVRLRDSGEPVQFALLPCATDPPSLSAVGAPGAGDTGARQLLAGQPELVGVLRSEHGEVAAMRDVMLVRQGTTDELTPFDAHVLVDGDEVFAGRVAGAVHIGVEFGRAHVELVHGEETLTWLGAEVVVKAGVPVEAYECVAKAPARLRHTWTVEPDGFLVYAGGDVEATPDEVGVLLLVCGDSDLTRVLSELDGEATVEVLRLPDKPSREDIDAAFAQAGGRRVAVRAGNESFEFVVHHLRAGAGRVPVAILPDPDDPVQLGPDGAPFTGSGVAQLLTGTVATAPILRDAAGASALAVNLWDAGPQEEAVPFEATIWVDDREIFDGVTDGVVRIRLDVVGDAEVEFASPVYEEDGPVFRRQASGTTVTVKSPALLEAADAVEVKGTGHHHVWTVDPDGFDIYVGADEPLVEPAPPDPKEARERAERERLLADPPPETTSTGALLLRILLPILLLGGIAAAAVAALDTDVTNDEITLVYCAGALIAGLAYLLSGKYGVDRAAVWLVIVLWVFVCSADGRAWMQNLSLRLTGHEVDAVVSDEGYGGNFAVVDKEGKYLASVDGDYTVGDHVTMVLDPNDQLTPQSPEEMHTVYPVVAPALLLGSTAGMFVLSGVTWRRRRRENYAKYLAIRTEAREQSTA